MNFFVPIFIFLFSHQILHISGFGTVGVNYGLNGYNLPKPNEVINLYERCGINIVRIFEPKHEVLDALRVAADVWVNANVVPYYKDVSIAYITVGNEVVPGDAAAPFVATAIQNIIQALVNVGVQSDIKVTDDLLMVARAALEVSSPPSDGVFTAAASGAMKDIGNVLGSSGAAMLVNVYPYFAYASNPQQISHSIIYGNE
ncbi:unnamed protein product [Citrullus colocynthis]|uniref:glucan endo-1,3-beta-D-glucosidase n=1 Tax=Citrullus colocynthis TaxID=252529 RepID=A0ABP0Z101_9ROSI